MDIIQYLLNLIQYLYQQNCWLISFICRYIPLKQWVFDDLHSPKYQKLKIDELPKISSLKQDWDWNDLLKYYKLRYGKTLKPVQRRGECNIPEDCHCPRCNAPMPYLYKNNGDKGQLLCKVCSTPFSPEDNRFLQTYTLRCPHCDHTLVPKKNRKHFILHKCANPNCSYYQNNLKKADPEDLEKPYQKNKYKLHYLYREFVVDFFKMDIRSLPKNASSLKFTKNNAEIMGKCLTLHVNLGLSLRKTTQAMKDLYGVKRIPTIQTND